MDRKEKTEEERGVDEPRKRDRVGLLQDERGYRFFLSSIYFLPSRLFPYPVGVLSPRICPANKPRDTYRYRNAETNPERNPERSF